MKKEKMLLIGVPVLCLLAIVLGFLKLDNKNTLNDSIKFKNEYEKFNGEKVGDKTYSKLNISGNNPIKYSSYDEIINIIKKGTGIIYLGFPECPWCRSALPVLFDVAKNNNISTIYYLNIKDERDSYVVENDKLVYELDEDGNEKKGTKGYLKLLKVLDDYLSDYTISYDDKLYETKEKRIYAPTVIFVKDGDVIGLHVSTVESQKNGFDKLTKSEKEELYNIYEDYILEIKEASCSIGSSC